MKDTPTPKVVIRLAMNPMILTADSYIEARALLRTVVRDCRRTALEAEAALRNLSSAARRRGVIAGQRRALEGITDAEEPDDA
jgi:hypothetical protein